MSRKGLNPPLMPSSKVPCPRVPPRRDVEPNQRLTCPQGHGHSFTGVNPVIGVDRAWRNSLPMSLRDQGFSRISPVTSRIRAAPAAYRAD